MSRPPDHKEAETFQETPLKDKGETTGNRNEALTIMTTSEKTVFEELKGTASEILNQVKRLIREGNARQLVVKNRNGRILLQSQLTIGVAGSAFAAATAPFISAIAMLLLFVNDVQILVERDQENESEKPADDENEIDAEVIEITDDEDESDPKKSTDD